MDDIKQALLSATQTIKGVRSQLAEISKNQGELEQEVIEVHGLLVDAEQELHAKKIAFMTMLVDMITTLLNRDDFCVSDPPCHNMVLKKGSTVIVHHRVGLINGKFEYPDFDLSGYREETFWYLVKRVVAAIKLELERRPKSAAFYTTKISDYLAELSAAAV